MHVDMEPAPAAAGHRHWCGHRLRHRHAGIGKAMAPEPAVVGECLTGKRAYRRIAGLKLSEDARDGCRIEGGAVLDDEQK